MKRLQSFLVCFLSLSTFLFVTTGCLDILASGILYQNEYANKTQVPEDAPVPLQKIDLTDSKGNRTVGWYHEAQKANAPVLLFFHGNGTNIKGVYDSGLVDKIAGFNVHFVIFDYPKYGLSTGDLNQAGVLSAGQAVLDFTKARFPNSRVIMWGRSLGCGPATLLTEKNKDVAALILTSPWDSFWKLAKYKTGLPDSACKSAAKGNEYESEVAAKNIEVPVLIHHGTKDEVIPFYMGENMAKAFEKTDVVFSPVVDGTHNELLGEYQWAEIYRFLQVW